jgi:hypothetical protein
MLTRRILSLILLFVGEALCVYAEVTAAQSHAADPSRFTSDFFRGFAWITLAGALLIVGYMMGYASFRNIWIITVASITSILVAEPTLTYAVFREVPGRGPVVGLILGALGLVATLVL